MYKYLIIIILLADASLSRAGQYIPDTKEETENEITESAKEYNSFFNRNSGSGYLIMGEMEYGIAVDSFKTDFIKFSLINGYRFNPFLSLGFGVGIKTFLVEDDPDLVVPLFLDIRVCFIDQRFSPYLALGIGYAIDVGYDSVDDNKHYFFEAGDILINPTAGVKFKITGRSAANIGIGCEMQSMRFNDTLHQSKLAGNSTCISINAGISF